MADTPTADTPADLPTVDDITTRPADTRASAMIGRRASWAKLVPPDPDPTTPLAPQWSGPQPGSDAWLDAWLEAPPVCRQVINDLKESQMAADNKHSAERAALCC